MGEGLIARTVVFAITAGITCASLVVLVFGIGFRVPHIWWALVPAGIGAVVLLALRTTMPKTDGDDELSV